MTRHHSQHPRLATRALAVAAAVTLTATVAGCSSSQGKTGPTPTALQGTWSCEVDGDRGTKYNDDGPDDPISFFGGDTFTVTVTRKRFAVEGERDGAPVKASGIWTVDYRKTKAAIGLDFWDPDNSHQPLLSVSLPPKLTREDVHLKKDNVGNKNSLDTDGAEVTASASRIQWEMSGKEWWSSGLAYSVSCSR